jgi:hypothetical protein
MKDRGRERLDSSRHPTLLEVSWGFKTDIGIAASHENQLCRSMSPNCRTVHPVLKFPVTAEIKIKPVLNYRVAKVLQLWVAVVGPRIDST